MLMKGRLSMLPFKQIPQRERIYRTQIKEEKNSKKEAIGQQVDISKRLIYLFFSNTTTVLTTQTEATARSNDYT
jgi:hypothetical protein